MKRPAAIRSVPAAQGSRSTGALERPLQSDGIGAEQGPQREITEHEGNRVRAARLWRLFEQNSQGQHHKNRAGIGDLPFQMPAFGGVRLHMWGDRRRFHLSLARAELRARQL